MARKTALRRTIGAIVTPIIAIGLLAACTSGNVDTVDLPAQSDAAMDADVQAQFEAAVNTAMSATGSTGAIVGVWTPWAGSWVAAVGDAKIEDHFRVGNVTRAMTCDVLYALAANKTVTLDDSVTSYVASVSGLPDEVTLGTLCDGTSGLGPYVTRVGKDFIETPERRWNRSELIAYGVGSADPTLTGVSWRDSDAGYVLLGLALERASGQSIASLIEEYVAEPLQLEHTILPTGEAAAPGEPALKGLRSATDAEGAVQCDTPTDVTVLSASMGSSNSGVVSTISDLGRYAQALAQGATGPASASSDRFADPKPLTDYDPTWFTAAGGAYQAGTLIGEFGSVPGYIVSAFSDTETGLTVAVVLNNSAANDRIGAYLSWQLAAIASKAPAVSGNTAPSIGLPWTAQQYHDEIVAAAVCPIPES